MVNITSVLIFLCIFLLIQCGNMEDSNTFIPSKIWQVVKKGQKIPKGLHVRINFETGQTEAKLLDDTNSDNALSAIPETVRDELSTIFPSPEQIKVIKDQFRSYDEIKKSLDEINLSPKMDAEVITDLLQRHKDLLSLDKTDYSEQLNILEDLDFLVHQYDNAQEFVNQNGFKQVIYKNLNSTNNDVKKETLKLLTAVLQNNLAPKIHALETGLITTLLRLLNLDSDLVVQSRTVASLGALLRLFPAAQKSFIDNGGFTVLASFLDDNDPKLQIRIIALISDLIVEHKSAMADDNLNKYYSSFELINNVLAHDWCQKLNKLLLQLILTDTNDYDSIEKCLVAMLSLRNNCESHFNRELLINLQKQFMVLCAQSSDGSFFKHLHNICDEILYNVPKDVKTEL